MPTSFIPVVRVAVIVVIVFLLLRAGRAAWARRGLAVGIWQAIRPRHVIGSLGLMVLVLGVALTLLTFVPPTRLGLGSLIGLDGNAVFAPIDDALQAPVDAAVQAQSTGEPVASVPWTDVVGVTAFLGLLVVLFPHLAHGEEEVFRTGWEELSLDRQVLSALRFGLVHLVMLIPVAAALAVGAAGFVYGRIYRRGYRLAAVPQPVFTADRRPLHEDESGLTRLVMGPPTPVLAVDRTAARREAVFGAAVWHTTFNTTIVVVVWIGYLLSL